MTRTRAVVASKNPDKVEEIETVMIEAGVVDEVVRNLAWPDIDETGATLTENAVLKAKIVAETTGLLAIADDTGLEVSALGGAPGVFTARFAGPNASYADNVQALLVALSGEDDRSARFRTVMAAVSADGSTVTAEGHLDGDITTSPRGLSGFGYDPIFEVAGRTLAEMEVEEKHRISHRARAIRSLADALRS